METEKRLSIILQVHAKDRNHSKMSGGVGGNNQLCSFPFIEAWKVQNNKKEKPIGEEGGGREGGGE